MSLSMIQTEINLDDTYGYIPMVACPEDESTERLNYIYLRPSKDGETIQYYKRKKNDDK